MFFNSSAMDSKKLLISQNDLFSTENSWSIFIFLMLWMDLHSLVSTSQLMIYHISRVFSREFLFFWQRIFPYSWEKSVYKKSFSFILWILRTKDFVLKRSKRKYWKNKLNSIIYGYNVAIFKVFSILLCQRTYKSQSKKQIVL